MVGIDERRGAFSMPIEAVRGDAIAFAWPDALLARDGLRAAVERLRESSWLLHFSCRARDAGLYGDADVESAWVAAHADGRHVLGTVAPFQIGPGPDTRQSTKSLVHSSILAALPSS
jgi:small ligand-binding sensory domain FIST